MVHLNKIATPINTVTVLMINPINTGCMVQMNAAADSGLDIDAIDPNQIANYKKQHLIKTDKLGIVIGT